MSIQELKDETMEQKLAMNKTVCKIIETVYMKDLFQSIVAGDKLVAELSAEEYLKVSEMMRDDLTTYNYDLVLQIVRCLTDTRYNEYVNFVILNLYYYLFLYKDEYYGLHTDLIEILNSIHLGDCVDGRIIDALLYLVRKNIYIHTQQNNKEEEERSEHKVEEM